MESKDIQRTYNVAMQENPTIGKSAQDVQSHVPVSGIWAGELVTEHGAVPFSAVLGHDDGVVHGSVYSARGRDWKVMGHIKGCFVQLLVTPLNGHSKVLLTARAKLTLTADLVSSHFELVGLVRGKPISARGHVKRESGM